MWLIATIVLCGLLSLFYLWARKRYRYFEDKGIPYLKPIFLLGSPTPWKAMFGREHLGHVHAEVYRSMKGAKFVGFYQLLSPILVLRDPEIITRVLIKDFSHFHDRGIEIDEELNPLESHLFLQSGGKWRTLRIKLAPTFTSSKLKWMYPQMESCCKMLLEHLQIESKSDEVEIREALTRFTTDVIGSCGFGYEPDSLRNPDNKFREMGKKAFSPSFYYILVTIFRSILPSIFFPLKIKTVPPDVTEFFTGVIKQTFEHRTKSGIKRNDFVQLLLQLKQKGVIETEPWERSEIEANTLMQEDHAENEIELTDNLLTGQAFGFFVAGFETSASSLSFTLYFLAKHQEAQDKARREIREVKEKFGGFTYEALRELSFTEACFKECVRLYPPIPVLLRQCSKTLVLEDGTIIDKGLPIIVPVMGLHMDPDIYPEPEKYRPERFIEGQGLQRGTFLPFGAGPRVCIGERFALLEIKLAMAQLLDKYKFKPGAKLEEPLEMQPTSFILKASKGIWLKIEKLEDVDE